MRRFPPPRRRGETFEQWKSRKDRENGSPIRGPFVRADTGEPFTVGESTKIKPKDEEVFTRDRLKAIILKEEYEIHRRFRTDVDAERQDARDDGDDDKKLTFYEWLHKKELEENERKKCEESRKLELTELERMKKEKSRKAVNEWMMRTKYRAYARYFPNMRSENVNKALLDYMKSTNSNE